MTPSVRSCTSRLLAAAILFGAHSATAGLGQSTLPGGGATELSASPASALQVSENSIRVPRAAGIGHRDRSWTPGEVEIAQYGQPEDQGSFQDAGFQVVRFDPPFEPPYTITKIRFPSFTLNSVPAVFPSVRLCEADPINGLPLVSAPLFQIGPYSGSANGENEILINHAVSDSGKTFYWCIEFPSKFSVGFPNDYPFIRMDAVDMERGYFASSFQLTPTGAIAVIEPFRNLIVSMSCRLASEDHVPLEASSNLGANRIGPALRFFFVPSGKRRADGTATGRRSLLQTDLLFRASPWGRWQPWASVASRGSAIDVDGLDHVGGFWTTQSVDKHGHRSINSSVVFTSPFHITGDGAWDDDEPNGNVDGATPLVLPVELRRETIFPAGDRDYYTFQGNPGETIDATAFRLLRPSGYNDLDLIMQLFDDSGRLVASDDNSYFETNPRITLEVPQPSSGSASGPRRFVLLVADIGGSPISPSSAPRVLAQLDYGMNITVGGLAAKQHQNPSTTERFRFRLAGPNPATGQARLLYVLPPDAAHVPVRMEFYNVQGRRVRSLVTRDGQTPGSHLVIWDGTDDQGRSVPSGTYYARISAGSIKGGQKISILR